MDVGRGPLNSLWAGGEREHVASIRGSEAIGRSRLINGIARVDLRVQDIGRALAFYRDVAGLQVVAQTNSEAELGSPGTDPFLVLRSDGVTAPADPSATGLFHTAFRFPTRTALGDALARLIDAGYEVGAGDHLVSEALYIDDPDGNGVELYWDRPVEQWPPPTNDMLVPMATLAVDLNGLLAAGSGRAAVGEPAPPGTDIGHVHLQVANIEPTIRFYATELGLDLTARMGRSAGFFSSFGYHHHIGANTWRSHGSEAAGRERAGLERVVFAVDDEDELNRLRERVPSAAGGSSEVSGDGVLVHDPDDIELRFVKG